MGHPQPARGADRNYCPTSSQFGHAYAAYSIPQRTLTHRLGVWYRVCQLCSYIDLSELADIVDQLIRDRDWEHERANEAARLSAEARDQADDLRRQIGELREQIGTVESDRLDLQVRLKAIRAGKTLDPETRAILDQTVQKWESNR